MAAETGAAEHRYKGALSRELSARAPYLFAAFLVIVIGLILRLVPLGLPFFMVKYAGSVLWGAMVCLLVRAFMPSVNLGVAVSGALAISVVTELSRLYHTPELDTFRQSLAGVLLLGRIFSVWNIVAYAVGIALAAAAERVFRPAPSRALSE